MYIVLVRNVHCTCTQCTLYLYTMYIVLVHNVKHCAEEPINECNRTNTNSLIKFETSQYHAKGFMLTEYQRGRHEMCPSGPLCSNEPTVNIYILPVYNNK